MFDCPEHIHTSPTSTSWISRFVVPAIAQHLRLAFAFTGSSFTVHLPSRRPRADLRLPGESHRHLRARRVPAPDGIGLLLLEHHVVADDGGELEFGAKAAGASARVRARMRGRWLMKWSDGVWRKARRAAIIARRRVADRRGRGDT